MKDIKFRGKRVDNGEWVYGDLHHGPITGKIYIMGTQVIPETVGQYAGFDDTNGVEVFEGDVMQEFAGEHAQGVWEYSNVSVVEDLRWIPESLGFADCTYIIGNIHDNPELKEATKHEN